MPTALRSNMCRGNPSVGSIPLPSNVPFEIILMEEPLTCAKCGLPLPVGSSFCDCGFPAKERPALDRLRSERRYRNLYLFANAFIGLGMCMILASIVGPFDWGGVVIGVSSISSAGAFWSLAESEGELTRPLSRRRFEYAALAASALPLFSYVTEFSKPGSDLVLLLVMPASYGWLRYRQSTRCAAGSA
jgi:hypothetical protein